MKKNDPTKEQTNLVKLQKFFEGKFDSIEKQIQELDHNQKVSNQKNDNSFNNLRFRIMAEAASTRENLEKTLRAEIQVANHELKNELKNEFKNELGKLETRLNKRLTHVADLITIQLGSKVQNHQKRIVKLEQTMFKKPKIN